MLLHMLAGAFPLHFARLLQVPVSILESEASEGVRWPRHYQGCFRGLVGKTTQEHFSFNQPLNAAELWAQLGVGATSRWQCLTVQGLARPADPGELRKAAPGRSSANAPRSPWGKRIDFRCGPRQLCPGSPGDLEVLDQPYPTILPSATQDVSKDR